VPVKGGWIKGKRGVAWGDVGRKMVLVCVNLLTDSFIDPEQARRGCCDEEGKKESSLRRERYVKIGLGIVWSSRDSGAENLGRRAGRGGERD